MSEQPEYTPEEVRAILQRAVELDDRRERFSRDELLAMAREVGLSEEAVLAAERAMRPTGKAAELARARQAFIAERRQEFKQHVLVYACVNLFLVILNVMFSPDVWWFIFPAMGWGIGLAFHAFEALQTEGPAFEDAFESWYARRYLKKRLRRKIVDVLDRTMDALLPPSDKLNG
nr:2TM domain-containing protein [Ardenticatena sp.]